MLSLKLCFLTERVQMLCLTIATALLLENLTPLRFYLPIPVSVLTWSQDKI